jgi:tetratricopeptide (TPR) repeat protein
MMAQQSTEHAKEMKMRSGLSALAASDIPNVLAIVGALIASAFIVFPTIAQDKLSSKIKEAAALQKKGEYLAAIAKANEVLEGAPTTADALGIRGSFCAQVLFLRYESCAADLTKYLNAQSEDSTRSPIYSLRAAVYENHRKYEAAISDLTRAIESEGGRSGDAGRKVRSNMYARRGFNQAQNGNFTQAVSDSSEAIQIDPTFVFAYLVRGYALVASGKEAEAVQDLSNYLSADSDNAFGIALQGRAFLKLNRMEEAKENASKAARFDVRRVFAGENALVLYDWDTRRAKVTSFLKAATDAQASANWSAAFDAYLNVLSWGMAYSAEDQRSLGLARAGLVSTYPKLTVKPPVSESARRYLVQAQSHIKAGKFDKALEAYWLLELVAPWFPDTYFNRALILAEHKWYGPAIENMTIYVSLSPDAPDVRRCRDKIYEWEALAK